VAYHIILKKNRLSLSDSLLYERIELLFTQIHFSSRIQFVEWNSSQANEILNLKNSPFFFLTLFKIRLLKTLKNGLNNF